MLRPSIAAVYETISSIVRNVQMQKWSFYHQCAVDDAKKCCNLPKGGLDSAEEFASTDLGLSSAARDVEHFIALQY